MLFLHFIAKRARIFLQKAGTIYHFIFHRYIISYVSISLETKYEYMWGLPEKADAFSGKGDAPRLRA